MNANGIPVANRTLRQLQKPGGFHLSEFGYRATESQTNLRRRALRRMLARGISMRYVVRRLKLIAIWNNAKQTISRRLRSDAVFVRQRLYPEQAAAQAAAQAQPPPPPPGGPDDDFGHDGGGGGGGMDFDADQEDAPVPPAPAGGGRGRGRGRGAVVRGYRVGPYVLRARRQPARRSARLVRGRGRRGRGRGRGRGG